MKAGQYKKRLIATFQAHNPATLMMKNAPFVALYQQFERMIFSSNGVDRSRETRSKEIFMTS